MGRMARSDVPNSLYQIHITEQHILEQWNYLRLAGKYKDDSDFIANLLDKEFYRQQDENKNLEIKEEELENDSVNFDVVGAIDEPLEVTSTSTKSVAIKSKAIRLSDVPKKHRIKSDIKISKTIKERSLDLKPTCYPCSICKPRKYFLLSESYAKHVLSTPEHESAPHNIPPSPLQCLVCSKEFKVISNLRQHDQMVHSDMKFKCPSCPKEFGHKRSLQQHRVEHSGKALPTCASCGKIFNKKLTMEAHYKMVHLKERPFHCHLCQKTFLLKSRLTDHLKWHEGEVYLCQACGAAFQCKQTLVSHQLTHRTGEFPCDLCDKSFPNGIYLKRHKACYHNPKKHQCDLCAKLFFRAGDLRMHMSVHSDARPFSCDICGKTFKGPNQTAKHKKKHIISSTIRTNEQAS